MIREEFLANVCPFQASRRLTTLGFWNFCFFLSLGIYWLVLFKHAASVRHDSSLNSIPIHPLRSYSLFHICLALFISPFPTPHFTKFLLFLFITFFILSLIFRSPQIWILPASNLTPFQFDPPLRQYPLFLQLFRPHPVPFNRIQPKFPSPSSHLFLRT